MNHFKIAAGGLLFAVAIASVLTFAVGRTKPPPPVVAAAEPEPPLIAETYREIALSVLRQSAEDTRLVQTEAVKPPAPPAAKAVEASVVEQKRAESNICTRNNMKKVWVSKYKWRCRK